MARTQEAVMTKRSPPMSTSLPSTACRCSSLGPKRTMAWKRVRASLREARFAKRTCPARGPKEL